MIVEKKVSEYGKTTTRQRIDINKSDGFKADEEVVVLSKEEYQNIKNQLFNLQIKLREYKTQLVAYENIDLVIEETVKKTLEVGKW